MQAIDGEKLKNQIGIKPAEPVAKLSGFKHVADLPPSDEPWRITAFGSSVIFFNEDHGLMVYDGGEIRPLSVTIDWPALKIINGSLVDETA